MRRVIVASLIASVAGIAGSCGGRTVTLPSGDVLSRQVTIRRDTFGIPHILAETEEAAAFGFGYAQAEDHAVEIGRRYVESRGEEARVFGEWEKVVGPEVAAHSRPVKLEDGELTVEAESTAWATQLRLLAAKLIVRIASEVGNGVVKKLHIHGPAAPSWSRGPRRVRGRGPRDTYG